VDHRFHRTAPDAGQSRFSGGCSPRLDGGVLIAAFGFAFTQSVATGGWLESAAANFGPRAEAVVSALGALVTLTPTFASMACSRWSFGGIPISGSASAWWP